MSISKPTIVVTRPVPGLADAIAPLQSEYEVWVNPSDQPLAPSELKRRVQGAVGVIVVSDRLDQELIESSPDLKVISVYGVGYDNVDIEAARRQGIVVTNLPHEVTDSTAELAIALMLACARRLVEADAYVRSNNPFRWTADNMMGTTLAGKSLGLIGFGRIGQRVAEIGRALGMRPFYFARTRRPEAEARIDAAYLSLPELLTEADVLSLHVPSTPETLHLIDQDALARMKESAILINTARGNVVDEAALVEALKNGRLRAAGLDVYEKEPAVHEGLIDLENVVLAPHVGTSTIETRVTMTQSALENALTVLRGEEPANRVC